MPRGSLSRKAGPSAFRFCIGVGAIISAPLFITPFVYRDFGTEVWGSITYATLLGACLLAAGLTTTWHCLTPFLRPLQVALLGASLVAVSFTGHVAVHSALAGSSYSVPILDNITHGLLKLFHTDVSSANSELFVETPEGPLPFRALSVAAALGPWLTYLLVMGLALACLSRTEHARQLGLPSLFGVLIAVSATCVLRYTFCILLYAGEESVLAEERPARVIVFWNPVINTLSLCTASLLAPLVYRRQTAITINSHRTRHSIYWLVISAIAGGSALGASVTYEDPGVPKSGRILVDDTLSGIWEPAGRLLTRDRFGDFSAYSFSAMVEHLSHRYSVTVNQNHSYHWSLLDTADVLILKTPKQALTNDEVSAILAWVHDGGGLFLISDHTDLLGMSTNLNRLAHAAGMQFRFDSLQHIQGGFNYWQPSPFDTHSVTHGLGTFELMTGCSIDLTSGAEPIMLLRDSVSVSGDYSRPSHFGQLAPMPNVPQGNHAVAAAATYGSGRILAFADSTVLSSFAYYMQSHDLFTNRAVAWLNRKSTPLRHVHVFLFVLGILAVYISFASSQTVTQFSTTLLIATLSGWVFGSLTAHVTGLQLRTPAPTCTTKSAGFLAEGGHVDLPPVLGSQPPGLSEYSNFMTFVQVPQRLGFETQVITPSPDALKSLDVLVIINPDADAPQPHPDDTLWISSVNRWVDNGGHLIILQRESHFGHDHDLSHLYGPFSSMDPIATHDSYVSIYSSAVRMGRKTLIVGSEAFSTHSMGHCMKFPTAEEREKYGLAYLVFDGITPTAPHERRTYRIK